MAELARADAGQIPTADTYGFTISFGVSRHPAQFGFFYERAR
uniref:Uncharacterized protein n=1 Tax=Magnetospirillum gryphiswaldense TaxID=55518 RepID=A4U322_9PROT|nr:hypothetical protein MGR_2465 [Magnetospirillum gryphiswaldense MSR-1]